MSLLPTLQRLCLAVAAAASSGAGAVWAQGPVLADPQYSVFAAFPAADSYRVIVRDIDAEARKRIEARLPFRVHYDELGTHSLYVAWRGRRPMGMIYVQHEESAYGLAVVEWALTFDMLVSSFRFQRVRSQHRRSFEKSEFVRLLKGRSREELTALLGKAGLLLEAAKGVDADAQELAAAVVRSGVKSMAVIEAVWAAEIGKLHDIAVGLQAFPQAVEFSRILPPPPAVAEKGVAKDAEVVFAIRAFGSKSKPLGVVVAMRVESGKGEVTVSWVFDIDDVVIKADVPPAAPRIFRAACNDIEGRQLGVIARRDDAIGRAMQSIQRRLTPSAGPGR